MVYCIGLTGGIASGKSTVAQFFSNLGIQIIYADTISKQLTAKDSEAYQKIIARYGGKILTQDNDLDRSRLRTIIFSDPQEKFWLESLLHPLIRQKIKEEVLSCATPYCMVEIPLLINKKNYPYINRVLLVDTPREIQIARLMQRDQCDEKFAIAILEAQPTGTSRLEDADDIIINDGDKKRLEAEVNTLHALYIQLSSLVNTA